MQNVAAMEQELTTDDVKKTKRKKELFTFLRSQLSSLVSSVVGELTFFVLRYWDIVSIRNAGFYSTALAGIIYFLMGKYFAFKPTESKTQTQLIKYIIVWIGNLYLNWQGPYWVATLFHLQTPFSQSMGKLIVGLLVGFIYNYPLYRYLVFSDKKK